MDADRIARFTSGWPVGQNHPEAWFILQRRTAEDSHGKPIENGLCLRLRLAYGKAVISDLRLNGHPLPSSETDGFVEWVARGCTHIQINIPAARLGKDDLFVVTCEYDPGEKRSHWDSWKHLPVN
jgi:hypothetical protein